MHSRFKFTVVLLKINKISASNAKIPTNYNSLKRIRSFIGAFFFYGLFRGSTEIQFQPPESTGFFFFLKIKNPKTFIRLFNFNNFNMKITKTRFSF